MPIAVASQSACAHAGAAPPRNYFPPTANGATPTLYRGLPDPVIRALGQTGVPIGQLGLFIQAVDQPIPLLALNAEEKFVLASTAKVVTTLAALDLLGPAYRWRTEARLLGTIENGRLDGDLLIVGGGDSRLRSEELSKWFAELQSKVLREIGGNIVLDRLAFHLTERDQALAPRPGPERPHHNWPDALSLGDGVLRLQVEPASGRLAGLSLQPPLADVTLVNEVRMGRGCVAKAEWEQAPADAIQRQLRVTGNWGAACGQHSKAFALLSDSDLTARAVGGLWTQAGGALDGHVIDRSVAEPVAANAGKPGAAAKAPVAAPLPALFSTLNSQSLPQLVHEINKTSDNMAARALMLSLSPGFPTKAATAGASIERMQQWLRTRGVPAGDIEIDSGSGLSRAERGKPRAMVQLLRQAWYDKNARLFVDSLPVAGVDGTLAGRMREGPAVGRAYLKTGSLLDVRAIAGFVRSRSGRVYAVSALINHPDAPAATAVLDALVEWVAALDR
ncbi:MAG: D-alanyl-D-alanine carboxypeptidase/D-alanyl-D-alanine-endopeptidase [Ideonella sp.]